MIGNNVICTKVDISRNGAKIILQKEIQKDINNILSKFTDSTYSFTMISTIINYTTYKKQFFCVKKETIKINNSFTSSVFKSLTLLYDT